MKTAELEGAELDYWVTKTEKFRKCRLINGRTCEVLDGNGWQDYSPSRDWSQGGPIIERERIKLVPCVGSDKFDAFCLKNRYEYGNRFTGPTPLIAAMRARVASKYGNEVWPC